MPHGKKSKFATRVVEVIKRAGLYKRRVILESWWGRREASNPNSQLFGVQECSKQCNL